ncbi:MAG: T9SS type A sorting domain-containing protein [Chitinophagaceae bacterium]
MTANPARTLSLPSAPGDNAGKANLRDYQYHGTSTTCTPGSYSGGGIEINPDDAKIVWNDLLKRWEVTFDITGFSGFFVSSSSNEVLPLTLLFFDATVKDDKALFEWTTTNEIDVAYFELQRSTDGSNYSIASKITAKGAGIANVQYNSTDKLGEEKNYYYRLKIVDRDGSAKYSDIIKINCTGQKSALSVFPNPAHGSVVIATPAVSMPSELRLIEMTGRVVKVFTIGKNSVQKTTINLLNFKPGTYKMIWTNGIRSSVQTFIIE